MDFECDDDTSIEFKNHFSLTHNVSSVKFRGEKIHVYSSYNDQMILRETDGGNELQDAIAITDPEIDRESAKKKRISVSVSQMDTGTFKSMALRAAYTFVSFIIAGFLLVACFDLCISVFLFFDTNNIDALAKQVVAGLFSAPLFMYSMGSTMAIAGTFVADTWRGNNLFVRLIAIKDIYMEWIFFMVYLIVPCLTMSICLASRGNWWEITAFVWVISVFLLLVIFALAVFYHEITSSFTIINLNYLAENNSTADGSLTSKIFKAIQYSIEVTQIQRYSGVTKRYYLFKDTEGKNDEKNFVNKTPFFSQVTKYIPFFYETMNSPEKVISSREIHDYEPVVTSLNWSLASGLTDSPNATAIVSGGPSSLTRGQVISSLVYVIIGYTLLALVLSRFLVWFEVGAVLIIPIMLVIALACYSSVKKRYGYIKMISTEDCEGETEGKDSKKNVYAALLWKEETCRITRPTTLFCWVLFVLEIGLFFIYPLLSMFIRGQMRVGSLFLVMGLTSLVRFYFNVGYLVQFMGGLKKVKTRTKRDKSQIRSSCIFENRNDWTEAELDLRSKSTLNQLVSSITYSPSIRRWMILFGVWMVGFYYAFIAAIGSDFGAFDYKVKGVKFVHGFEYKKKENLKYPTCVMSSIFSFPGLNYTYLGDWAFAATTGYFSANESVPVLDNYYGDPGFVIDNSEFVENYRKNIAMDTMVPVSYKLYTFRDYPTSAVVAIRGSESTWDWINNIQLWTKPVLFQCLRAIIPVGWMWNGILHHLIYIIGFLENDSRKEVNYYHFTSNFVDYLKENTQYKDVKVTGVSLGGGIAIITGAKTQTPAISISGVNAMLSRKLYGITKEDLNDFTFNVIPERDIIAKIDDPALLNQKFECRGPYNSIFGCHSMWRGLCESVYQCGSNHRPILCWCSSRYGYPAPEQTGNVTWEEACEGNF